MNDDPDPIRQATSELGETVAEQYRIFAQAVGHFPRLVYLGLLLLAAFAPGVILFALAAIFKSGPLFFFGGLATAVMLLAWAVACIRTRDRRDASTGHGYTADGIDRRLSMRERNAIREQRRGGQ